jgi:predicted Fe-Mo cluster-binding NifX family protein
MSLSRLAVFSSLTEANLVKAKLEAHGIDSVIEADVGSSTLPVFESIEGVRVFVREEDLADAYEVLERMLPASTGDATE